MSVTHGFSLSYLFVFWIVSISFVMRKFWYQTMLSEENSFSIFVESHFSIKLIFIKLIEIVFVLINAIHTLICCKCILLFYFRIFIYCLNFLNYYMLNMSFLFSLSCVHSTSWILALIFLRIFPFLKIF